MRFLLPRQVTLADRRKKKFSLGREQMWTPAPLGGERGREKCFRNIFTISRVVKMAFFWGCHEVILFVFFLFCFYCFLQIFKLWVVLVTWKTMEKTKYQQENKKLWIMNYELFIVPWPPVELLFRSTIKIKANLFCIVLALLYLCAAITS